MHKFIEVELKNKVGHIRMNRPEALNALNSEMVKEIVAQAKEFDADKNIGAIVLTGNERAFAAGADIKEMSSKNFNDAFLDEMFPGWDDLTRLRTPLIAAVSGFALGGGCELAMACDIILAAENAKFGQPEINLGVIPGLGGTQRLTRAVGKYKAADMVLTGRMMDAKEAEMAGLVSRIIETPKLLEEATAIAELIASKSLPSIYAAKASVDVALETPLAEGLRHERHVFFSMFSLEDQKEGMSAFIEKRDPDFKNR